MKRRLIITLPVLGVVAFALYVANLSTPQRDYFRERPGTLERQDVVASAASDEIRETLELESSSGLRVDMRIRRPALDTDTRVPVLLIIGGHRTGKNAVDLAGPPNGIAFAAIDYPYRGSHRLDSAWQTVSAIPDIQRAFLDTPPSLSLALQWLVDQPWVDTERVELVGVSLGVPFAAVAGALNERFRRVWLIHGGADNLIWMMHAGRNKIASESLRRLTARTLLLLVHGASLQTADWVRETAPRPVVVIAARKDDFVPPESLLPFIEAAESDSVEIVWTDGLHIGGEREDVLLQLLAIVFDRVKSAPR